MTVRLLVITVAIATITIAGCSSEPDDDAAATTSPPSTTAPSSSETTTTVPESVAGTASTSVVVAADDFPDILAAQATREDAGTWRFDVTVSSPYDSPERYADAWRVLGPDGTEYGVRILTHDHASEQPFTRSQGGIEIPADITTVTIQGRDLANGWGGGELELVLP